MKDKIGSDDLTKEKVPYSPLEQRVLDAIPEDGSRINTLELAGRIYDFGAAPRYARQSALLAANSLIAKSDENKESWEILRSNSSPVYFWKVMRGSE
jgi:hypothetical protein